MTEPAPILATLKVWIAYAGTCMAQDPSVADCRSFWMIATITGLVIALLIIIAVAYRLIRIQLEYRRNRKLLEARMAVADPEVMKQYIWASDHFAEGMSQEALAALIRENKTNVRSEHS